MTPPLEKKGTFGPWPRKCEAIGAPANATKKRKTMKPAPAKASLSLRSLSQTLSQ